VADRSRFGPAGVPPVFTAMKLPLEEIPGFLRGEGLDAFEYEAIYWGGKPQVKIEHAESLGLKAKENDVWISMHGSYFINLCGERKIVEASKKRLVACATAADWMRAHVVVFHPGFYGGRPHEEAYRNCLRALKDVVQTMRSLGIRDVKIGPETMGKKPQFGSLDDILDICKEVEQTQLVIDWSHLHAREGGFLRTVEDFRGVVMKVEDRLGSEATRDMHCHFTKIEFTAKGERRHHTLGEERYGPDFEMLAKTVIQFKLRPVLICESPLLDIDAMRMRDAIKEELERSDA
jgi:deoxyribonuclease-4